MFHEGEQIGPYMLVRKLGKGGFGEVWLAEKRSQFLAKKVAIKLLDGGQVNFETIQREAVLWEAASGHPNVLPIIDADAYDDQVVIVSEYADGGSLSDRLQTEGKPTVKEAVELIIGVLNGLEFLHGRKIIHRDIKPQNILLQGKTPRLADFGISRAMQTGAVSSTIIGTDAYMSPEAFDGKRSVQSDIWSVGVVLYQLLNGSLPFPQDHPSERMFAVLTKDFEPLPAEIPGGLREIVQTALAKLPENRFLSAAAMREDLQKALVGIDYPTHARTEVFDPSSLPASVGSQPNRDSEATVTQGNWEDPDATFVRQNLPDVESPQIESPGSLNPSILTQINPSGLSVDAPVEHERNTTSTKTFPLIVIVSSISIFLIVVVLGIGFCSGGPTNTTNTASNNTNTVRALNTASNTTNATANPAKNMSNSSNSNYAYNTNSQPSNIYSVVGNQKIVSNDVPFCDGWVFGWNDTYQKKYGDTYKPPPPPKCPDPTDFRESMRNGFGGQLMASIEANRRINGTK